MQTQTIAIDLTGVSTTRLLARVITYVAGRGLELVRVDFGRAEDSAFLLLRVAGDAARLDPLPTQLERLPGVVWAGAPPGLRRSSPVAA